MSRAHQNEFTVILVVAIALLAVSSVSLAHGDGTQSSILRAYTGLAGVYASGGQAPGLVAGLNAAINLTEQARLRRDDGDLLGANSLDNEAQAEVTGVLSEIPAAQQNADHASATRTITTLALIPVSVVGSTFAFYGVLYSWRTYERRRLYEMRIVEKNEDY